ncbi:MAG: hypothetical protein AAF456_03070 [Planctomycetota bacterium]
MNKRLRPTLAVSMLLMLPLVLANPAHGQGLIGDQGRNVTGQQNPVNRGPVAGGQRQTTTRVIEVFDDNGRDIAIEIEPDGRIRMAVKRRYSNTQLNMLARTYPELEIPIREFPTVAGEAAIELTVAVTSRYEAADEIELQDLYPAAFNIYKRFLQEANDQRTVGNNRINNARGGNQGGFQPRPGQPRPHRTIGVAGGSLGDGASTSFIGEADDDLQSTIYLTVSKQDSDTHA